MHLPRLITGVDWESDIEVDPKLLTGWRGCGDTAFRIF